MDKQFEQAMVKKIREMRMEDMNKKSTLGKRITYVNPINGLHESVDTNDAGKIARANEGSFRFNSFHTNCPVVSVSTEDVYIPGWEQVTMNGRYSCD